MPTRINTVHWVVQTVGKHIAAEQALAGGDEGIGIDESAQLGIIITALEIVESGLSSLTLAAGPKTGCLRACG